MKLITEVNDSLSYLVEGKEKKTYIEGIFLQGARKNRNGRIYPMDILNREVARYTKQYIEEGRALGELGHPEGPSINLDRVSHKIMSLKRSGNDYIGKALLVDTPNGKIAQSLIAAGVKLGVSSRGMGSIRNQGGDDYVQEDFTLATAADIVADPSAPDAYVNGIMEGVEWVWNSGKLEAHRLEAQKKSFDILPRKSQLREEKFISAFDEFITGLKTPRN